MKSGKWERPDEASYCDIRSANLMYLIDRGLEPALLKLVKAVYCSCLNVKKGPSNLLWK